MSYTRYVEFYNKNRKPLKITEEQYLKLRPRLNTDKFIEINGESYNTSSIEAFPKIKDQLEPLYLPPPPTKPISRSFLQDMRDQIAKKFGWKKHKTLISL